MLGCRIIFPAPKYMRLRRTWEKHMDDITSLALALFETLPESEQQEIISLLRALAAASQQ